MAIGRDCHCDSVKKKCWKRFMLPSCVTIAVGGHLEIFNTLLKNDEQIKSAEMCCGLRGLILASGEEENASTRLESACWERHGYVLWGCGGIMEGTMEGMLMTHEESKILRTMTMMKTDSNDSQDSNSSNKSNKIE